MPPITIIISLHTGRVHAVLVACCMLCGCLLDAACYVMLCVVCCVLCAVCCVLHAMCYVLLRHMPQFVSYSCRSVCCPMMQPIMRHKLHHPSCRLSLAFCCVSTSPHVPLCVRFVYVRLVHGPCSVMCPLRVCPLSPRPSFHYAFSLIPTTYRNYSHVHTGSTNY